MKTPTVTSVKAAIKRAATAEGLYLGLTHSKGGAYHTADVRVREGFACEARDAGLTYWRDFKFTGTLTDWLRSVLTVEELRTVSVNVEVDNSEMQVDYFSTDYARVLPDWGSYVTLGDVSLGWAKNLVGVDTPGWGYDRGTRHFTESEIKSLAPSDSHAWALAFFITHGADTRTESVINRFANFNQAGRDLFQAMLSDWGAGVSALLDAVEALVPQTPVLPARVLVEAPVPQTPALVVPAVLGEMPQALVDYLGRLIHVPKKLYASRVYAALTAGEELPESDAVWADDVLKKVRRYSRA